MRRKMMILTDYINAILVISYSHLLVVYCHPSCGLYGVGPCQYVPAPPGHTPSCARPGKTYCEHVDNYPVYLIKHLVRKWGLEARNLIVDETTDEFNSLTIKHHDFSHFLELFGPTANHLGGHFDGYKYDVPKTTIANHYNGGGYPEPIYIPKPRDRDRDTDYVIYSQITSPTFNHRPNNIGAGVSGIGGGGVGGGYHYGPKVSQYNPTDWFKRYVRDLSSLKQENQTTEMLDLKNVDTLQNSTRTSIQRLQYSTMQDFFRTEDEKELHSRVKRQSPGRSQLCQTNSQFITPQAALNSKGNWMFVVNEMNTARQLVKTETCASTVCSNICQLPNGYNSRCEQKYVQKRLIALNSNGQNLYTDTFWFPSCCVCTLSNL